jgi:histidine ammonia-lyase
MGQQLMTIMLNGSDLTVTQVAAARHGEAVALAPAAIAAMRQARTVVQEVLSQSEPVYGLVSSNAFTTAWACIATADADALLSVFDVAGRRHPAGRPRARRRAGHPG